MGKLTISMAIFHSYVDITRGYQLLISPRLDTDSRQDAPVPNPKSRELAAAIWAGTRSLVPQKMFHQNLHFMMLNNQMVYVQILVHIIWLVVLPVLKK